MRMTKPDCYEFDNGSYDYVTEPNENLLCPICRNPFVDPVMCESTDHIFCRLCLIKSLEISATCPIDRLPLSISLVIPAPRIILSLVDELLVSCPFKSKFNCSFVCQRYLMPAHLKSNRCSLAEQAKQQPSPRSPSSTTSHPNQRLNEHLSWNHTPPGCSSLDSGLSSDSEALRFEWVQDHLECFYLTSPIRPCIPPESLDPTNGRLQNIRGTISEEGEWDQSIESSSRRFTRTEEQLNRTDESRLQARRGGEIEAGQELLKRYFRLERTNQELREQLNRSCAQIVELNKTVKSYKTSLKDIWTSGQTEATNNYYGSNSYRSPSGDQSTRSKKELSTVGEGIETNENQTNQSTVCSSPNRTSSDAQLHLGSSRLNYGGINGRRIRSIENHSNDTMSFSCGPSSTTTTMNLSNQIKKNNQDGEQLMMSSSSEQMSEKKINEKPRIRVSTFIKKGEILTPTDYYSSSSVFNEHRDQLTWIEKREH